MTWRDRLALAMGREQEPQPLPRTFMDNMDSMDNIPGQSNSVHCVHSVHSPSHLTLAGCPQKNQAPPLGPAEAAECFAWPAPTQRLMVAAMTHFEVKGHSHPEAETLAYATVKALMERHGGPVGFSEDPSPPDLPDQAMPEVEATAQRLVAGGWQADKAALLARVIVARRLGLPDAGPPMGHHDPLGLVVELVKEVFGDAIRPGPEAA